MALDTLIPTTRRNVLAAAVGGLAAFAAQAIGRPLPGRAADGDTMKVGGEYIGTTVTKITNSTNLNTVIWGASTSGTGVRGQSSSGNAISGASTSGNGVNGSSSSGYGVYGSSSNIAVRGQSGPGYGLYGGSSSSIGIYGSSGSGIAIYGTSSSNVAVRGFSSSDGTGVSGSSSNGVGVRAESFTAVGLSAHSDSEAGVHGENESATIPAIRGIATADSTGVQGSSGTDPVPLPPAKTGVYGYAAQDATARGVLGRSVAGRGVAGHVTTGDGLFGVATSGRGVVGSATTGIAGHFASTDGTALQVNGRARFSTSGRLAVAAGASEVTITLASVTTASMVLALLQSDEADVWVRAAVPVAGSFTVHFNTALATNAILGYFVIN